MRPSPWDRVTRSGKQLTRRDWALLEDAGRAAGVPINVVQGSWSGYRLSSGTHSGAGAVDLSVRGMTERQALGLVHELRRRNAAAWLRSPRYGWTASGPHIHAVIADTPGLSPGARQQVVAYRQGRNGLASRRLDPHPRPNVIRPFTIPGMVAPTGRGDIVRLTNLRYGKRNADVKDLQRALKIHADGWYGPVTDAAVRAHQKRLGWRPDRRRRSFVGPKQARALGLIPK